MPPFPEEERQAGAWRSREGVSSLRENPARMLLCGWHVCFSHSLERPFGGRRRWHLDRRLNGILSVFHHGFHGFHGKGIRVMGFDLPLIALSPLILEEGMDTPPLKKSVKSVSSGKSVVSKPAVRHQMR